MNEETGTTRKRGGTTPGYPGDGGLKKQVRSYDDTFSAWEAVRVFLVESA